MYLSICKLENEAILRDLPRFWTWQHQKRSKPARLPQLLNLTTSKTKQFCKTSSIFEVSKSEAILRDFLQKWKVECRADGLVPMRFAIFPVHVSKVLRLPRKSDARSYEVLHLSRKIILANLKIWCSKMQPLSGNQRPDLLTSLMNMSFVLRLPRKMHLCRSSSNVPRLPWFLEMRQNPHVLLTFDKVHNPLRLPRETTSERPKLFFARHFLTWKCASRHNGVHFFDMSTSKSAVVRFEHFDLEMCFAPQRRPLFRHLNFQECSEPVRCFVHFDFEMCFAPQQRALFRSSQIPKVDSETMMCFVHFWLTNVLPATTACNFPSLIWPDGSCTRRFSKPTFRPCGATNHWKTAVFCDYSTFSRTCIFFPLTLSSDSFLWLFPRTLSLLRSSLIFWHLFFFSGLLFSSLLWSSFFFSFLLFSSLLVSSLLFSSRLFSSLRFSSLLFSSLLFSDSSHLCFSISPYCRKFGFQTSFDDLVAFSAFGVFLGSPVLSLAEPFSRVLGRYLRKRIIDEHFYPENLSCTNAANCIDSRETQQHSSLGEWLA